MDTKSLPTLFDSVKSSPLEIGCVINDWTIVGTPTRIGKWGEKFWKCRCTCGSTVEVSHKYLVRGESKGCIKCRTKRKYRPELVLEKTFGNWTARAVMPADGSQIFKYECHCVCGRTAIIKGSLLRTGRYPRCLVCNPLKMSMGARRNLWRRVLWGASTRKLAVEIEPEEAFAILEAQNGKCALTGLDISVADTADDHAHGKTTASLDRIDSSKGYIRGNVRWLHKNINRMKSDFSDDEFMRMCKLVVAKS